ncbi:DeoR/GlpR family DNA-binding transcription regulator [Paenibacillus beijingensis]|uniref:DeoR faimly transcriptional regulator n=1 Tax=Paenibacillus beijingensis TaxID=1126833 RepID=A0A0D5NQ02_9BACL|nr:DeoR/GlpR family DNA-binding transcription regulator [Paenibacillus beijingensis]AJY77336.1 DeoR faimly transcriptional regulator [Paenibacillus beijingensis]
MLAVARHQYILEQLQQNGSVKVADLSEHLGVTPKTVREDLEKLEENGLLRRTHGGAVAIPDSDSILPLLQIPNTKFPLEKEAIAAYALRYIRPEEVIALDAGSTTLEIARLLPNEPMTVVTNDLMIMRELVGKERIQLVVPGGYRHNNVLIGNDSLEWVNRLNIQKVFLSAAGIHEKYGLSVFTGELIKLKKAFIAGAKEIFAVADHSKFDRATLLTFASLEDVDVIITDAGLDEDTLRRYERSSVRIEQAV